ncbi:Vms1/Ankzf1 family peptidyl-tRNA hydrolase [Salinirussus salinus]|jgi:peptide subunit release factor 1 (eRF1)|uniref:Vms1/Ankzf1 family peptidyl-tRNA hydrolase n=1 Tax=Salinirussus salinus TaxID=1198300 RepID=UPI0013582238|nr:Vms1/Ankzf1 family peptidyl-tRNA hydrolase [Salinirussus salinus]
MLDDLLGRTELKDRIADLEAEKADLQAQLEAEQERRAEAATARQEAEREVNRLEDRVTELEDRVRRLQEGEGDLAFRAEASLRGERLEEALARLERLETGPEGVLTAMVADGHDVPEAVRRALGERAALVSRAAPCLVVADDMGLVGACLSTPVAPDPFVEWDDRARLEREWFQPRGEYTLALVRSDLFAMGVYEDGERTAFHGFDEDIKSQHSKGGFSQARFERLRDEQIDNHLERCRAALEERPVDRLYLVGERSVLGSLADLATVTATVDATGEPEPALADAAEEFWTVQLRSV